MLDLDYILENTLYVVKFYSGHREIGTKKEIMKYRNNTNVKDMDICYWSGQPADLKEFHKAHQYAISKLSRLDLLNVEDFYKEWSENPNQFIPQHLPIISTLSVELAKLQKDTDVIIENYDRYTIGNHTVDNYIKALEELNCDFDVVKIDSSNTTIIIRIQIDNDDLVREFSSVSNTMALRSSFIY